MSPVAPPRDRASSILFTRVGLRKNSKATYSPLGLRKNFMLQCTGFTLGSLQFSERVLWESFNTSYFEASPRPKVPGGSYTSGLIRCLAARKPFCPADRSPPMSTYHTAARAWARWTIDAESMRGSEAPTPSRRCRRSWTIGDRFSRSAENRIGRPPRRYGCRAELKKKVACRVSLVRCSLYVGEGASAHDSLGWRWPFTVRCVCSAMRLFTVPSVCSAMRLFLSRSLTG